MIGDCAMGLFYKYKCKKCGKMYFNLPVLCYSCNTELSFICLLDMRFPELAKRRPTKDCEEIKQFIFSYKKKKRIQELENKIRLLEIDFESSEELRRELKIENERIRNELWCAKDRNEQLRKIVEWYEKMKFSSAPIPNGAVEAVKYAMKHAHPDNGGNAEDFMRFQKCYEELTRK